MKRAFIFGLPALLILSIALASPEDTPASLLEGHLWQERVLLLFTPSVQHPAYTTQRALLETEALGLKERNIARYDIAALTHVKQNGQILPHVPASRFFDEFNVEQQTPTLILIGKDGEEKERVSMPHQPAALFTIIDAMPMRKREMQSSD